MAEFIGVDDAICFSMGFATNSLNTPCLADEVIVFFFTKLFYSFKSLTVFNFTMYHATVKFQIGFFVLILLLITEFDHN